MKTKILVVLFVLLSSSALWAQDYSFGIKAGANIATMDKLDGDFKPGFLGGILFEYYMGERFSLQGETLISMGGIKTDSDGIIKNVYLTWPILGKFYLGSNLYFCVGPQINFMLSGKGGPYEDDDYSKFDLAATAGLGYFITDSLFLDARFTRGFIDVLKTSEEAYNMSFEITGGIIF